MVFLTMVSHPTPISDLPSAGLTCHTTSAILKALTQSHEDGCDVVNLSLGGTSGWSENPKNIQQQTINAMAERGQIVVIAAGNEGEDGSWYAASPAGADSAITVANVQA